MNGISQPMDRNARKGFTLVELFLVIVIIGFVSAIVFPALGRSIAGNRIRTASRNIIMAGRHARSIAVLQQKQVAMTFDLAADKITLVFVQDGSVEYERPLDKVHIREVRIGEDDDPVVEGRCRVVYENNGTCTPYRVHIEDDQGRAILIDVDLLSSVTTEDL